MASFPEGTSQSPKCRQITLDFHHGGAEIQSHGNIYSGYRLTFPASTTIRGLTRMPYLPSYLLHSIVSDQETSYHSKEVQRWGLPMELTGLTIYPSFPGGLDGKESAFNVGDQI